MRKNKLFVVLGIHRSGTSAITRCLKVLGVDLGDRIMSPIENDNITGFWEDVDINKLNIEILDFMGFNWHQVNTNFLIDMDTLHGEGYFSRAVQLLRQKTSNVTIFGFKDPRISLLLPFWIKVFDYCQFDVCYLLTLRHPLSVAKSLFKRDGFDERKCYFMWQGYMVRNLSATDGEKRIIVDYDNLMQSPEHELYRIAKYFDLEVDPTELAHYNTKFLDQRLRHTVYDLNVFLADDICPPIIREIYAELLDVASDRKRLDDVAFHKKVLRWSDDIECLKPAMLLIDKTFNKVEELNSQLNYITQELAERDGQLAERDGQLSERDGQLIALYNSASWRITAPLRKFCEVFRRLFDLIRCLYSN